MDKTKREELEKAYRKEKDSRVVLRMLAVHMVCVRKMSGVVVYESASLVGPPGIRLGHLANTGCL